MTVAEDDLMEELSGLEKVFSQTYARLVVDDCPSEFERVVSGYNTNLHRIASLCTILPSVALVTKCWDDAVEKVGRETNRNPRVMDQAERVRRTTSRIKEVIADNIKKVTEEIPQERYYEYCKMPLMSLGTPFEDHEPVITSLLQSIIVAMWTTFETMTGDLWEAALNVCPNGLAMLSGRWPDNAKTQSKQEKARAKKKAIVDLKDDADEEDGVKMLKLNYLQKHDYDLSKRMGTLYRYEDRRFTFQTLPVIRDAYVLAFGSGNTIFEAINHECFTALSKIRNVLVHKAGIVDHEFLQGSSKIAALSGAVENRPFIIDGHVFEKIKTPFSENCLILINDVIEWVSRSSGESESEKK